MNLEFPAFPKPLGNAGLRSCVHLVGQYPISGASTVSLAENEIDAGSFVVNDADGETPIITLTGPDAGLFTISGVNLVFKVSPDFEDPQDEGRNNVYDVTVNAIDGAHTAAAIVAITVFDTNEVPSGIVVSNVVQSIAENSSSSADIRLANIGIVDDGLGTNVLSISGPDTASFKILNGSLFLKGGTSLNFEAKRTYTISLVVDDDTVGGSPDVSTVFVLSVEDRNEAPILSPTHSVFSAILEDAASSNGKLVSTLLIGAFSDVDAGTLRGIAIIGLSPRVSLQYKLGAANWVSVAGLTETTALVLPASALVRLVPEPDYNGSVQFSYRAWDRSDGALVASRVNLNGHIGLDGAYSVAADDARLAIRPVNDAPVLLPTHPSAGTIGQGNKNPPGITVASLLTGASDVDKSAVAGVAIVSLEGSSNGIWQYRFGTRAWAAIGSVSDSSALLIPAAGWVRFVPNLMFYGQVKLSYRAWDGTQGSAGNTFSASENLGGVHAFSSGEDSCSLVVDAAPVLKQSDTSTVGYALNSKAGVHFMLGAMTNPGSLAKLLDPDSPNFDTGILKVRVASGGRVGDRINLGWNFSVSGTNVLFFNPLNNITTRLGTLTKSGSDGTEWSMTFNGNATRDIAQRLINSLRFSTVGGIAGQRKLAISVSDGDGATSNTLTRTINVG